MTSHNIVYAHEHRQCSNWFWHGSTSFSYPQCSLTFMHDRYLHRCREQSFAIPAYDMSAVGIDVVSDHKLFAYRVMRLFAQMSWGVIWHTAEMCMYHKIAEWIAKYKWMNDLWFYGILTVFQPRNGMKPATLTLAWNLPVVILVSAFEICSGLYDKHQL